MVGADETTELWRPPKQSIWIVCAGTRRMVMREAQWSQKWSPIPEATKSRQRKKYFWPFLSPAKDVNFNISLFDILPNFAPNHLFG